MSDTFYDAVGGEATFRRLVERFYAGVAGDPDLRPLYPEADLAPAAERLQMFLEQYWGGPHTYSDQRGHPRLRMRHAPFPVTPKARDSWLRHMRDALDGLELAPHHEAQLWGYLQTAADMMVNTPDDGDPSATRSTRPGSAPAMMPPGPAPITLGHPPDPPTSAGLGMAVTDRYPTRTRRRLAGTALGIVLLTMLGCSTPSVSTAVPSPSTSPARGSTGPGSATAPSRTVTKLLVVVEENHSLAQMRSEMPYTFGLAQRFGYATSYVAIQHPSEPNYIAIIGGQTYGISNDAPPAQNPVDGTSVFGQALAAGRTAAVYADGMTSPCSTENGGSGYAVRHNPWAYFTAERDACGQYDVPIDQLAGAITAGSLPDVGLLIPNVCHDAHDCPLSTADAWFQQWMERVFSGPDWTSGHLAVVLTADEDDRHSGNQVLTVVIHPSQHGNVVATPLTHYSLTRLYEEVAGTPLLFEAKTAPSMATAFHLPIRQPIR